MDRVKKIGIEVKLAYTVDRKVLRWFGHVVKMDEYHMVKRVLMAEERGWRVRGKSGLGWMDAVKVALGSYGMTVEVIRKNSRN